MVRSASSVGSGGIDPAALGSGHGDSQVDHTHETTAKTAGFDGVDGDIFRSGDAKTADDVYHHDAESKSGQSVHGIIPFQKSGHKAWRT